MVLVVVTFGIDVIGNFISKHFSPSGERITSIYQGGERLPPIERRYETESFYYTFFFMILHVLGFFAATMMVLKQLDVSPLNGTTLIFGFFSLYAIYLVRKLSTR